MNAFQKKGSKLYFFLLLLFILLTNDKLFALHEVDFVNIPP